MGVNTHFSQYLETLVAASKKQKVEQQLCTCITLFVHFFAVTARLPGLQRGTT